MSPSPPLPAVPARVPQVLLVALLALPWLWPWAPGPSVQVVPLLAAWACSVLAAAVWLAFPVRGAPAARVVAASWLVAALASSAIGLVQWFGGSAQLPGVHATEAGEAFANLRQRNQFASLVSLGWLAVLHLQAAGRREGSLRWQPAVLLLALGAAASLSRTGALQWIAISALAMLRPASRPLAFVALAAYAVGVLGLPAALHAWQGVEAGGLLGRVAGDAGCSSRRVLWSNVLQLIAQRPWLGWGAGELDYAHYATLFAGPRFCDILDNAHNLPLHLAVEFGLPLALAACGATAWIVGRSRPWAQREPIAVLAWGALGVVGLHSLLEYPLWYGPFQLAALLAVALLWPAARTGIGRAGRAIAWSAMGGALLALAWAGCAYHRVSQAYLAPAERSPGYRQDPLAAVRPGPFAAHAEFAELMLTPLDRGSAGRIHVLAGRLLHFSPEPRVIVARVESAVMLGRDDDALWHLQRFRAAFPEAHAQWARDGRLRH